MLMQRGDPCVVRFPGPNRGVQFVVIRNIVTVQALRPSLEIGRRITITDPERVQIRHDLPGLGKGELPVELQPVGGRRNPRTFHT